MKHSYSLLLLGISSLCFSQTTIYSENFSGQNDLGYEYNYDTGILEFNDPGALWSINLNNSIPDFFKVINEQFVAEFTNFGGDPTWLTPVIDISGYTNVSFSLDAFTSNNLENADFFRVQYRINGGTWTFASNNGNMINDFNVVVSQSGLSGNSLQLRIITRNGPSERHTFDNILVTGILPPPNDLCTNAIAVSCGSSYNGSTANATNSDGIRGRDVFYSLSGTALNEEITISLCGAAYDTFLEVYDACNGTLIVDNDDSCGLQSEVTFLSDGDTNYIIKVDGFSAGDAGAFILDVSCSPYCTVTGDTTFDTSITEVTFNGTTNTSSLSGSDDPSGYISFAAPIFQATQGEDYSLSVNLNTDGNFIVHAMAWIDWNQDFIFDAATEQYDLGDVTNTPNGPTSLSGLTISVPNNALPGDTKMRIVSRYLADPTGPCDGSDDGEIEDYIINVTPITYVYNNGWLPANPEGIATIHNPIEIQAGNVTLSADTSCDLFTIAPGNNLTINNGVTLTVQNGLTLESVSNNYSGLILNGTINGTVTYQRFVNVMGSGTTGGNDLVSAPLSGQTFGDFAAANDGVLVASGNLRAWAPFNQTSSGTYQNYNVMANANTTLEIGMGYRAATNNGEVLNFTGTVETGTVSKNITVGPGNFKEWNLIGNPYPSYISMEVFLQHEVAPGVTNMSLLKNASGIYGYDGAALDGWDVVSLANASGRVMAPGQGFFVAADEAQVDSYDIEFTPNMRIVASGDDFIPGRTAPLTYLKLEARSGNQSYQTEFYFNDNAGNGLDPGYDARTWGSTSSGFILYSHLVTDNTGVPIALQALHPEALNDVRIPLGINATAGSTINFSITHSQLPAGTMVYLEDVETNSLTLITQNNYQVTLQGGITGTGRFFLRFGNGTLSNNDYNSTAINIYHQPASETLVIAGQLQHNSVAYLYDLQGRLVKHSPLNMTQTHQEINVSNLQVGIYIIQIGEDFTRKVILR